MPGVASLRLERIAVDPAGLAARVGTWRGPALLEGGRAFGPAGRWSFFAAEPRAIFEARGSSWTILGHGARSGTGDPLDALAHALRSFGLADPVDEPGPDAPPFAGGMIGALGYDLAPWIERLPRRIADDGRWPDIRLGLFDTVLAVDHRDDSVLLCTGDWLDEGEAARHRRRERWLRALDRPVRPPMPSRLGPVRAEVAPEAHKAAVRRALDYIEAGDIFQVNLSQRFRAEGPNDPLDLYLRARALSPAPFSAFLRWGDRAVASASPEWFLRTRQGRIVTRPIKGTRPRSADPTEDARLAADLLASVKDRAELTMIVDLERNDLGRVCDFGTVRVSDSLTIESYAQVHHLVATVEGRLRGGMGPVDVLRATFPGGSITGAPKIRAMEIIDELEPARRGFYTGVIGFLGPGGSMMLNIAIRTILVDGRRVTYQVGGGIVADSDPEAEYEETLHKGRGLRAVLGGGGRA